MELAEFLSLLKLRARVRGTRLRSAPEEARLGRHPAEWSGTRGDAEVAEESAEVVVNVEL